jgi:hypothetical protein
MHFLYLRNTPRLFSDDFYLIYVQNIGRLSMNVYSLALSNSARLDICEFFTECLSSNARYAEDGANIMIENGWMEQPPLAADRDALANVKKWNYKISIDMELR